MKEETTQSHDSEAKKFYAIVEIIKKLNRAGKPLEKSIKAVRSETGTIIYFKGKASARNRIKELHAKIHEYWPISISYRIMNIESLEFQEIAFGRKNPKKRY